MPLSFGPLSWNGCASCSTIVTPICASVGKADFAVGVSCPGPLPISLAYSICSGLSAGPLTGVVCVAVCQTPNNTSSSNTDNKPALKPSLRSPVITGAS